MFVVPCTAAMTPTTDSRATESDVLLALKDSGYTLKSAAITMGVPISLLSEALSGQKHLSLQRLTALGPMFLLHFAKRTLVRLGGVGLSPEEAAVVRGAAALGLERVSELTRRRA